MDAYVLAQRAIATVAQRQAGLAERIRRAESFGARELVSQLRQTAQQKPTVGMTEIVGLPEAETLDGLWDALGFSRPEGFAPDSPYEVNGIYRRLAAGIRSIQRRGFSAKELLIGAADDEGWYNFQWESDCGKWGHRHWRVIGKLRLRDALEVTKVIVCVKSTKAHDESQQAVWTAFIGGPLDNVLTRRLTEVIPVLALRTMQEEPWLTALSLVDLTEDELDAYHDLHPHPVAAWTWSFTARLVYRVVLWDDDYGSGHMWVSERSAKKILSHDLIAVHLDDVDHEPWTGTSEIPRSQRVDIRL